MHEVEAQRALNVRKKPVAHEAGPPFLLGRLRLRQTLQKRETAPIRLSKLHDTKQAEAVDGHRLPRALREAPAQRGEFLVPLNGGYPVVIGVDRDGSAEKPGLEEADDKLAEESRGL